MIAKRMNGSMPGATARAKAGRTRLLRRREIAIARQTTAAATHKSIVCALAEKSERNPNTAELAAHTTMRGNKRIILVLDDSELDPVVTR
jgi:hypothetical protein